MGKDLQLIEEIYGTKRDSQKSKIAGKAPRKRDTPYLTNSITSVPSDPKFNSKSIVAKAIQSFCAYQSEVRPYCAAHFVNHPNYWNFIQFLYLSAYLDGEKLEQFYPSLDNISLAGFASDFENTDNQESTSSSNGREMHQV